MELQLALTHRSNSGGGCKYEGRIEMVISDKLQNPMNKKRSYDEAFDDDEEEEVNSSDVPKTLSLFVWKAGGNDDPDDESPEEEPIHYIKNDDEEEENGVVGWPPIKSWRRKICHQNNLRNIPNYVTIENRGNNNGGRNGCRGILSMNQNSMFVKVKMEGVGIARKVDLSLHHSFQTLIRTLFTMFGKCHEDGNGYRLTYQNKEGDWLLAGDVPWGTFMQSVQRLKLLKSRDKMDYCR